MPFTAARQTTSRLFAAVAAHTRSRQVPVRALAVCVSLTARNCFSSLANPTVSWTRSGRRSVCRTTGFGRTLGRAPEGRRTRSRRQARKATKASVAKLLMSPCSSSSSSSWLMVTSSGAWEVSLATRLPTGKQRILNNAYKRAVPETFIQMNFPFLGRNACIICLIFESSFS
jgi:hypothetical protein